MVTPGAARSRAAARSFWAAVALLGTLFTVAPAATSTAASARTPAGGPAAVAGAPVPTVAWVRTIRGAPAPRSGPDDRTRTEQGAPAVPLWTAAQAGAGGGTAGPAPADLPRTPPAVAPPAGPGPPAAAGTRSTSRPATPGAPRAPPSAA